MLSKFYSYYNLNVNNGCDWVEYEDELSAPETVLGFTTQVRRLTLAELPVWAAELWELYAGQEAPYEQDRAEFVSWVGDNGASVAEQIDWLSE